MGKIHRRLPGQRHGRLTPRLGGKLGLGHTKHITDGRFDQAAQPQRLALRQAARECGLIA